ncbi:ATP-binding protein [Thioclava litoralis]|uniref:histidine kinase n=1 Tax=Thioclava litoralis TaxID=3076557 RepID=A0ABZ1DY94_9RHOB|nr:ATP-binding protein [Thioclava sp. FTW29]
MQNTVAPFLSKKHLRRGAGLLLAVTALIWASVSVWYHAADRGMAQARARGQADLRLASDRLVAALSQYREDAVLAADHPYVRALAAGDGVWSAQEVAQTLQRFADLAGAEHLVLLRPDGRVLAAPEGTPDRLPMTEDVARAAQGALGRFHGVEGRGTHRIFAFAAPVFATRPARGRQVVGIVRLTLDAETVEATGRGDPLPVWFSDDQGVVFTANRAGLIFRRAADAGPADPRIYPADVPFVTVPVRERVIAGQPILCTPQCALPVVLDLPVIGLTGHAEVPVEPILHEARVQMFVVALAMLAIGALFVTLWARRQALADRLASEAALNAALESRVALRTTELREANAALLRTQAELVQAGKLSALGQMSAGISHELNQPLMAIGSFAENAGIFLARGQQDRARDNLRRIGEMSDRMGRIIRNLRAFARPETEPASPVDMARVIETALEIAASRLAGVPLDWAGLDQPVWVMGGETRLAQVVVNLLSNAVDACAGQDRPQIRMRLCAQGGLVRLEVQDNGPGIADPERMFDPFYSTKEVGTNEGMGLGLSISYRIVQSFGGTLTGTNLPDPARGAMFALTLRQPDTEPDTETDREDGNGNGQ